MSLLLLSLAVAAGGLVLAIVVRGAVGRAAGFLAVLLSAGLACGTGIAAMLRGSDVELATSIPYFALRLDAIAGFFLAVIGGTGALAALYALGGRGADERGSGRSAASAACLVAIASLLACTADNVLLLLFAWELLALAFFWAITFGGDAEGAERAGYFTLVLTHVAGGALAIALLTLARFAGSFEVAHVVAAAGAQTAPVRAVLFILLLVGFGAKFGMLPMQAWLRYGYSSAPSVVVAFMAGGALNVGFYGIARFVVPFGGVPPWLGALVLGLGAAGAVYGIALAVAERDLRALAAYSSVENAGIILAAFGVAVCGRIAGNPTLYALGVAAAFLAIVAHAIAKVTLFLVAATLRERCGSTSFERLGGLAARMPLTTAAAIAAAGSLSALPPLVGFAAEWLVLESMMQAFRTGDVALETALAVTGALVGLAAAIAVVAFVKTIGIAMLGAPRSPAAAASSETPSWCKRMALGIGGLLVVLAGVGSGVVISAFSAAVTQATGTQTLPAIASGPMLIQPAFPGFSSASPAGLLVMIGGFACMFWVIARLVARPPTRTSDVWSSGSAYEPWMQYTGTGFANPTRVILDAMTRTVRDLNEDTYDSRSRPYFGIDAYAYVAQFFLRAAGAVRRTQSGAIAAYLAYILGFVILLLLLYPSIRRW